VDEGPDRDLVREAYRGWEDKGPVVDGRRLTVLSAATRVAPGQPALVYHVAEVTEPGRTLWIAGPKAVVGEYVDGAPVTPPPPPDEDPLEPLFYDGKTLPSPGLDLGWEVTEYAFDQPGRHDIQWRLGDLVSNVLTVDVVG
jgi:hypothetical protein